ncbi:MAG: hypothetical protein ACI9KE_002285 [Polyangiales bacterium]|jgi:hypothetical protein
MSAGAGEETAHEALDFLLQVAARCDARDGFADLVSELRVTRVEAGFQESGAVFKVVGDRTQTLAGLFGDATKRYGADAMLRDEHLGDFDDSIVGLGRICIGGSAQFSRLLPDLGSAVAKLSSRNPRGKSSAVH